MELYSLLSVFFIIGAAGIFLINRKDTEEKSRRNRWLKYIVYLILVFGQLFLINIESYLVFSILIAIVAAYEMNKIRQKGFFFLAVFITVAMVYMLFFEQCHIKMQQFVFITVITFDGYSQLFGQLFGKTKLFPKASPGKTFEGLIGGIISVGLTALILSQILKIEILQATIYGFAVVVLSVSGDFLASLYKRINGVKDFSALIPAHGGILDRFDSLIFSTFGFYFLMKVDFLNVTIITVTAYVMVFMLIFLLAEIGYHLIKLKTEITRKFVHLTSGICCLSFPFFIENQWIVLLLCSSFLLLLISCMHYKLLKSVNNIDRKSYGSLLFPVSVYLGYLCFQYFGSEYIYFYLPIIVLAVCDPLAALIGKTWPIGPYKIGSGTKTIMGSVAFFISCFVIIFIAFFGLMDPGMLFGKVLLISATATFTEAYSRNGFDNLTIPLSIIACMSLIL